LFVVAYVKPPVTLAVEPLHVVAVGVLICLVCPNARDTPVVFGSRSMA
jgi:hypothetical protein